VKVDAERADRNMGSAAVGIMAPRCNSGVRRAPVASTRRVRTPAGAAGAAARRCATRAKRLTLRMSMGAIGCTCGAQRGAIINGHSRGESVPSAERRHRHAHRTGACVCTGARRHPSPTVHRALVSENTSVRPGFLHTTLTTPVKVTVLN
jgi:hypothetical protein